MSNKSCPSIILEKLFTEKCSSICHKLVLSFHFTEALRNFWVTWQVKAHRLLDWWGHPGNVWDLHRSVAARQGRNILLDERISRLKFIILGGAIFFSDAFLAQHIFNLSTPVALAWWAVTFVSLFGIKKLFEMLLDPVRGLALCWAEQGYHRVLLLLVGQSFHELVRLLKRRSWILSALERQIFQLLYLLAQLFVLHQIMAYSFSALSGAQSAGHLVAALCVWICRCKVRLIV